jgi:hypothetical protein
MKTLLKDSFVIMNNIKTDSSKLSCLLSGHFRLDIVYESPVFDENNQENVEVRHG